MGLPFISIDQFKIMDYKAIHEYYISIELMMENAGFQLARFVTRFATLQSSILIGIGTGNNGGGGLVAARRLAGWGYQVHLDIPDPHMKDLTATQFKRAVAFGASPIPIAQTDIFVDAFFGFSQRLPLTEIYLDILSKPEISNTFKISLDLPSGFNKITLESRFNPNCILSMAAPKTELIQSDLESEIYVADIGIPQKLYNDLGVEQLNFNKSGIVKFPY